LRIFRLLFFVLYDLLLLYQTKPIGLSCNLLFYSELYIFFCTLYKIFLFFYLSNFCFFSLKFHPLLSIFRLVVEILSFYCFLSFFVFFFSFFKSLLFF